MAETPTDKLLEKILNQLKANPGSTNRATSSASSGLDNSDKKQSDFVSTLIQNQLKNNNEYLRLQNQIRIQEEKLVKLKTDGNAQETIGDRLAKNLLKLEKLRAMTAADVHKGNKSNAKVRDKEIQKLAKENKMLLDQEKRERKILRLKEKQGEEQDKINKKNRVLLATDKGLKKIKDSYQKITDSNAWKESTGLIKDQAKQLTGLNGGILGFISKTLSELWEQDSVMSKLSANYALSRKESAQLKDNITRAAIQTQLIGVSTADLVKMQQSYTNEMGRSVILTEEGMVGLAEMGVATHLGAEGAANMAASMELFGYSAEGSVDVINKLSKRSKDLGVSNSVVSKKFQENLKVANSYTFKDGIEGVKDMTLYSTKLRINMQSIANFADKVSSPEGAIRAAASLQVLGGSFASMSDPMVLLNQGITDMKGLTKTYAKMLEGIAEVNKETGEVSINGYDRLRVKAAAEAMGVSFDEMMTTARTQAKRKAIVSDFQLNPTIGKADEDTKDLIASLAQYKKGRGFEVNVKGKATSVAKLSAEDIQALQPKDDSLNLKTIAEATLGLSDLLQNAVKAFMQKIVHEMMPAITKATTYIAGVIEKIFNFMSGKPGSTNNAGTKASTVSGGIGGMLKGIGNSSKLASSASKGGVGSNLLKGGSKFLGKKIPGIGALITGGAEFMETGSVARGVGSGLGSLGGAAAGAALGTMLFPGLGTGAGALVGLILGSMGALGGSMLGSSVGGLIDQGNDVLLPSKGKPIKLNNKDDVFAMKPGGAIVNALQPSLSVKKTYGGVEQSPSGVYGGNSYKSNKIDLNISGTLNLVGGNSATKISASELVKDRQFVRELTRIISSQLNRDSNGGKVAGGLTNNSF